MKVLSWPILSGLLYHGLGGCRAPVPVRCLRFHKSLGSVFGEHGISGSQVLTWKECPL